MTGPMAHSGDRVDPPEPVARYAYLGPAGTFTEQALLGWLAGAEAELVAHTSVEEALDAVRRGVADGAMVPFENSIEGSVSATLDALAFGDMGGRMSFSAAMLDDAGDGLVITSINGRTETRTYAKGIKAAGSDATLSPEEEQAISYARRSATS